VAARALASMAESKQNAEIVMEEKCAVMAGRSTRVAFATKIDVN
jgi:hypothetical protein